MTDWQVTPGRGRAPRQANHARMGNEVVPEPFVDSWPAGAAEWGAPAGRAPVSGEIGRRNRMGLEVASELLADDFFRLCHHDATGRLLLSASVAGVGLGASLLAELALTGQIRIADGYVHLLNTSAPTDALAHRVLDFVVGEQRTHSIRTWLAFLSTFAYEEVADRLVRSQHVRPEVRGLLRRTTTYVPTDINIAAWPAARLSTQLRDLEPLNGQDLVLAGVARATDLHHHLLDGASRETFEHLSFLISTSARAAQELLDHTKAALGDAVMSAH